MYYVVYLVVVVRVTSSMARAVGCSQREVAYGGLRKGVCAEARDESRKKAAVPVCREDR